jgi:MFS family permease
MLLHLRNPRLLATFVVGFCVLFTLLATFNYINFYLAAPPFSLSTAGLGLIFTVYLAGAFVTGSAGRLIDRLGHRFTLTLAFAGGIGGICLTLLPSLAAVVVGLALLCSGVWVGHSSASSYIGTVARDARASAVGLYVMCYYIGGSAGSALSGHFWNRGGWPACVALIVVAQVITIVVAMRRWRPE